LVAAYILGRGAMRASARPGGEAAPVTRST
ncbi:MAG: hypothetical protein JWN05_2806, partial [Arthrobacter sp.]|nr:hypothetical protein [Arthrobacter sp.]